MADESRGQGVPAGGQPAGPEELYRRGCMHESGAGGVPPDYGRAMECFWQAARQGHALAQCRMGAIMALRRGWQEAREWFRQASAQGCAEAQMELGFLLLTDIGGPKDARRALELFTAASGAGSAKAMAGLSLMAEYGIGAPEDMAGAESFMRQACAAGGDAPMLAFRQDREEWLRQSGAVPRRRVRRLLARLDTPAKRISLAMLPAGLAFMLLGSWEFAASRLLSGAADFFDINQKHFCHVLFGFLLLGTGVFGMSGTLDRFLAWIKYGSGRGFGRTEGR